MMIESQFYKKKKKIGHIVRDERFTDTIWCLCNNYEEYLQFAKDLFLYKGLYNQYSGKYNSERWIKSKYEWSVIFDVPEKTTVDDNGIEWEEDVDPIMDTYDIREKPDENEYPVIIHYDNYHKNVIWISFNKLKE